MGNRKSEKPENLELFLGTEAFYKLAERFAGKTIYIPKRRAIQKKREAVRSDYRTGATYAELASRYGYSERHIRGIVNGNDSKTP
jgi:Mor family transcriptional regulator